MKAENPIQYVAIPARVFMTILILLVVLVIGQISTVEIVWMFRTKRSARPPQPVEKELTEAEQTVNRILLSRKEFLPDGTLHLVTGLGGPRRYWAYGPRSTPAREEVYDVNDRLLWEGPAKERPYTYLSWAQDVRRDYLDIERMRYIQTIMPDSWRTLLIPVGTEEQAEEIWRYCPGSESFVGYGSSGQRLGYLGATGWAESKSQARPFGPFRGFLAWCREDSYSPVLLWQTHRRIYQISLEARQADLIYENPRSPIKQLLLHRWDSFRPLADDDERPDVCRSLLHCWTEDGRHHVVLKDPVRTITVTIPDDWAKWLGNHYEFAATEQGLFMRRTWVEYPAPAARSGTKSRQNWWDEYRRQDKTQWVELYRVSEAGELDLLNRFSWIFPGRTDAVVRRADPRAAVRRWVNAFSPILCDFFWVPFLRDFWPRLYERSEFVRDFFGTINDMRPDYRVRSWLVTLVLVGLTFVHGRPRRTSRAALAFWLVFVALLNLAGFLTYWALNHTPVIRCSACGKHRGLGQGNCVRCGGPLAVPKHGTLDLIFGV